MSSIFSPESGGKKDGLARGLSATLRGTTDNETGDADMANTLSARLRGSIVSIAILGIAIGLIFVLSSNWTTWASSGEEQKTDDAYLRADVTPLSTKAAGLVASVEVSDYQPVKAGDLLARLQDDDFRAQVAQAEAALQAGDGALLNNQRQKELQDARIQQAQTAIVAAEAEVSAAEAGIHAADSALASARSGLAGTDADVQRTALERKRQEALVAAESATRQRLEQAVADEERFQAQRTSRLAEIDSAGAQLASREADLRRARAHVENSRAEVEAQHRQRSVLDSQEQMVHADLKARQAALDLARTNLSYTRIVAPKDGIVGERKVRAGQLVSPGTQIVSLVEQQVWVQANYRETQLQHIRAGDPAEIRVDAFPGLVLKGRVEQIAPASGSQFALLPPDNATGNFTKVTQRVPVKIILEDRQSGTERLRPGLSVAATIRTKGQSR
jgi:membrane fusion protein (multidrug efflux system)